MHSRYLTFLILCLGACAPAMTTAEDEGLQPEAVIMSEWSTGALIDSLPLRDRIAQIVMPWIGGGYTAFDEPSFDRASRWVDSLHVGGIIISIGSPLDVAARLNRLQRLSPLPLLVSSDLESGTTFRLVGGTPFPPNMGVGAAGREMDAYQIGRITAIEGRAVGIHVTFAPVADLNNNPANPIINTRSFGEDAELVSRLVAAAVEGIQDHDMVAAAKHFPGHGDTGTDSHIALPVITAGWARLDSVELVPFRAAIDAGVGMVMSAHIALPGIDSGRTRPGTVAPNILTGLLRDSLGFDGIVVTDALNMGALVSSYGAGEAAVLAFEAGADLLLQPADPAVTIDAMEEAIRSGRISEERLNASLRRILELKRELGLFGRRTVPLDSVGTVVGSEAFRATADEIGTRAVVLASDATGIVDSLRAAPRSIALVTYSDDDPRGVGTALAAELRAAGHRVTVTRLWPASGTAAYDTARREIERAPYVVFAPAVRASAWRGTLSLPDSLAALVNATARARRTVLISLGTPYMIQQTPAVGSYLLAWASNATMERAAARALSGAEITGTLPIRIPPGFPLGAGLERPATGRYAE